MDGWKCADTTAAGRLGRQSADTAPPSTPQGSVFMFQRRRVPINWRHLAGLDVDRVFREMDIQALQQNISNVTFCNIESEEFHGVDGNFIKLFRLAQLTIEYLLHCQQYLTEQKNQCEQQLLQLQKEVEVCRNEASAKGEEMKMLKRENRKRRKIIEAYQDMLSQGATGLHPCPVCSKEFVSQQYMDSHMQRRHPDHLQHTTSKQGPSQEEIQRRLMEQINERFQVTERQLREELAQKERESLQNQTREFEQWKQSHQQKRKEELDDIQAPLLEKLRVAEQEKEQLHRALQETQAKMDALKRNGHTALGSESVDYGGEVKGQEVEPELAAAEVKRLETNVVSKWKKHRKNVHRQMQQMNQSYQEQLLEISEKLASMERSTQSRQHTSPDKKRQQEKKKQEEVMKKELHALQQKITEQERMLSSQNQQLVSLQTKEPSPAHSASSTQDAEKAVPVESQSDVSGSSEEEDSQGSESDYPDTPQFTPFPHRTTVTTLFNHEQEAMEKIRRETVSILDNALMQRGVTKGSVGMTDAQLESKMKLIEAERRQRIQMHSQFMEQRQSLVQEVELSATANCQFHPPRELLHSSPPPTSTPPLHQSPHRSSPHRTSPLHPSPPPSPRKSSPLRSPSQQTSPQKQQSRTSPSQTTQQPTSSNSGRVSSKPPTGLPHPPHIGTCMRSQGAFGGSRTARQLEMDLGDSETESGTETESESDEEDDQPVPSTTRGSRRLSPRDKEVSKVPAGAVMVLPTSSDRVRRVRAGEGKGEGEGRTRSGVKVENKEEDTSSWDSEDSDDQLTTQDLMSVPTSTPVQVLPSRTTRTTKVPISGAAEDTHTLSDNSWDVTEISGDSPLHLHSKRNAAPERRMKQTSSTHSGNNSQSALTTVTHGDFDDSDPSDISTTQLT